MYSVIKRNKRLYIINSEGEDYYSPPNFLRNRINRRQDLVDLCDKFNDTVESEHITLIMEFEKDVQAEGWRRQRS